MPYKSTFELLKQNFAISRKRAQQPNIKINTHPSIGITFDPS
jgi:hypothetical protein